MQQFRAVRQTSYRGVIIANVTELGRKNEICNITTGPAVHDESLDGDIAPCGFPQNLIVRHVVM